VVTRVPKSTQSEMQSAVDSAKNAFKTWSQTSILTRQQTMFKYQALIKDNLVCFQLLSKTNFIFDDYLFDD
jgi:malonate-semialdehyde dehydrogenase (acetylating)/methylmalonate-semialdehyde dehydrogenase